MFFNISNENQKCIPKGWSLGVERTATSSGPLNSGNSGQVEVS